MSTRQAVKIPMEVQMSIKNSTNELRRVADAMQEQFKNVDMSTSFGKQYSKIINQIQKGFANIEASTLGSELFDESDFKRVASYIEKIDTALQNLRVHGTSGTARQLGLDITAIEEAEEKLKRLKKAKEEYAKTSVGALEPAELSEFEKHKKDTGFSASKTYKSNIYTLTSKRGVVKQQLEELKSETHQKEKAEAEKRVKEAEKASEQAKQYYEAAVKDYEQAKKDLPELKKAKESADKALEEFKPLKYKADVAQRFKEVRYTGTTKGGKIRRKADVIKDFNSIFESEIAAHFKNGKLDSEGQTFTKLIAEWLNYNPEQISALMRKRADNIVAELRTKFNDALDKDKGGKLNYFYSLAEPIAKNFDKQGYADAENAVIVAQSKIGDAEAILKNRKNLKDLEAENTSAKTVLDAAEATLKEITDAETHLTNLSTILDEQIKKLDRLSQEFDASANDKFNDDIQQATQEVAEASDAAVQEVRDALAAGAGHSNTLNKNVRGSQRNFTDEQDELKRINDERERANKAAEKEAADFKKELSASIKHWMSAQQIINVVKDGIRQAYQDIKALDSAMTNIAVVTDMSVGDLWGKINEYMSIAKQYGVTTQGVYEVSQLYYQQGLSTNEVMAATTETLKMARIAGMGYAEAADAMTVAIRAFKMNMTDAGHVTDVYSKVAAVTASDSEELAIAMSKTASSAESVGSSFENTTSMLAVMIETTRESAQNLGSALKSIISRYGEMKVGLKVDSEGEEIDYNKVDTALKSVGISIKDAQGQFRDFDDVIFELSKKWDSLDKNTQRYIATIMAGNRQQSRFIALVDNWERLEEVSAAAADSADAGLLQYAKTLDSLDTKLNTLKTNFQQFYMSIFNGEFFKGIIDIVNNIVANISNLGPILGSLSLLKLINQIKLIGQLLINSFSGALSKLRSANKEWQNNFTNGWEGVGEKIAQKIANALIGSAAETGKAYVAGVKQGAEGEQPVNNAESKSVSNFTHLTSLTQELTNPSIKATKRAKWALGLTPSGKYATNNYYTQAQAILNDPNAHAIDKKWAEKINRAYAENVAILSQNNGNQRKQLRSAQRALQLVNKANQERNEQIQLLEDENNQISKRTLSERYKAFVSKKGVQTAGRWASVAGTAASMGAMMIDTSNMQGYDEYTRLSAVGGVISAAGQALSGDIPGAILTLGMEIANTITRITNRAKVELENAKKAAEEANIKRVEKKDSYTNLNSYLQRLEELNKSRGDSIEAEAEWLALNNEVAEKYPELISYIDTEGNSIVNLTTGYAQLDGARKEAMRTNAEYWKSEMAYASQYRNMHGSTKVGGFGSGVLSWETPNTKADLQVIKEWVPTTEYYDSTNWTVDDLNLRMDEDNQPAIYVGNMYHTELTDEYRASDIYPSTKNNDYDDWVLPGYLPQDISATAYLSEFFTEDRTVKDFADKGINLSAIALSALQDDKTAKQIGSQLGLFNIKDNQIVYTPLGKQILEYQNTERNYYEKARTSISSTGSLWLQTASQTENLADLAQVEQLLLIDAIDKAENNWTNLTSIDIEKYFSEGADGILEFWSTATQSEKDTINDIITNIGSYTTPEIEKILKDYGLEAGTVLYDSILKMSESAYVPAIERMSHIYNIGIPSFSEFASHPDYQGLSKEEVTQKYIEAYKTQIKDNTSIPDFLLDKTTGNFKLSANDINGYFDSSVELNKRLKDKDNVLHERFQNQRDLIEAGYELLASGTLEDDAEIELRELLTADDFGSRDWSKRVQEWNAKWGATYEKIIDESTNIITESFFIYVDGVLDKVDSTLDSFEDIAEKHSKGFTFEEARDLLKRYQQLDGHANATFDEVFDILEDGTIVLNDLSLVTSEFYAQQARDMEKASKDAEDSIKQIGEHIGADDKDAIVFTKDTDKNTLTEQLLAAGIDPTMIDSIIAGIADGTIQTWNDVIAFLTRTKEEIDAGVEYYNKQTYQAKFNNWKNTKYNKAQDINFDLIGATWAEEYQKTGGDIEDTDAFNQFMERKLAQIEGAFIDASGNLIITDANAFIKYLNSTGLVDESTLQTYTAQIEDAAIETVTSIFDLITKAIEGTLTASELVSLGEKLVNSGRMSAEEWSQFAQANVTKVGTGYKMNEAAAFVLQVNTGNYDFEELVDQFDSIEEVDEMLEEVNEMLEELGENSKQFGDEFADAAKRVLESIKMIKAQDPSDAMFNWMDQDMEGWAGTYESTMGSISKAGEVINASMESGTMGLNDFYNMSQIVGQYLAKSGDESLMGAWIKYRDAVYGTATAVDGGTVSIVASTDNMIDALGLMTQATQSYYNDLAEQQIAFIDKQIATLEAQKAVEEALNGYNNSSDTNGDGTPDYSPDNYKEIYDNTVITGKERDNSGNVQQGATGYDIDENAAKLAYYRNINNITDEKWNALTYQGQQNARAEALKVNEDDYQKWFVTQFIPRMDEVMKAASAAGMNLTDPAVVQSLADTALDRMGIEGYEDIFSNSEELETLTKIQTSVANIEQAVAPSTTESNPEGTGTVGNGSGSGNDANYDNPQTVADAQDSVLREQQTTGATQQSQEYKEEPLSNAKEEQNIEQQALAEDQQQTEHQASIAAGQSFNPQRTPLRAIAYEDGTDVSNFIGANAALLSQVDGHYLEEYMATRVHANSGWGLSDSSTFVQAYQMLMQSMGTPMPSAPYYSNEELQQLPTLLSQRSYAITKFAREVLGGQDRATLSLLQQNMQNLERYGSEGFDPNHPLYRYNFSPSRRFVHELGYWQSWVPKSEADKAEVLNEYNLTGKRYSRKYTLDEERTLQSAYNHGMISDKQWTNWQQIINNDKYLYAATHGVNFKGAGTPDEFTGIDARPEGTPSNIAMHHYKRRNAGDTDRSSIFANHEAAFKEALYWNDVYAGKYDNWTEDTPDVTTLYDPSTAVAPQEHAAARLTTAGDLALDLQQAGDRVVQGFEQLLAGGAEAWSRVMGEEPTLSPSELEAKAIADAVLGALDNLDNYNDNDELNYAAAIIEVSKTLQKLPEEWIPLLQKALGPDGTAKTYLSAGDAYKLQTDFTPMATFDTTTIKEDIQNAIIEAQEGAQAEMEDNPSNMPVDANIGQAQQKINQLVNKVKNTSPSMNVKVGFTYGGAVSGDLGGNGMANTTAFDLSQRLGFATGNVNGLAFATGTEKLIAGANLANKALVGELGPELAVYNGQYHLLGANGAEFANIPSNAIIFNHKQTEGILKGQANIRGRVKDGGEAFAEGNVSGPAYGPGNIDEAIKALQEARAMWQSLLDTPLDKIIGRNKASGGGSGISAVDIGELEEWYNLLRQIEAIQDNINLLVAERNNLEEEYNGEATLRNLRQQQSLLEKQRATQEQLIKYQRIQLDRQKNEILNDPVWNKFLTFDESTGAIQYTKGNELFGGKGAWEFLQDLDKMSAKEQIAAVNKLGYTAKDKEGKQLTGEKLVKHFVDAAKNIEEEYRNLDNTVRDSETELENIDNNINEIEQTIRDNEMALEQDVFDTIVDAWEANIDALEEQKDLIEEANDAYTEGLREALEAERKAYEDEASVADREQLQRELSLLRRSGGSASEIADLEEQIDNALKDEYFKSQEDMISDIEEANKNQIELLEKQIKIEEETLEYQKENGVIWQQVATILNGTKESIMAFLSGSAPGFFAKSKNQQVDALNEWSYMVGLYKEDQFIKNTSAQILNDMNNSGGKMWGHTDMSGYYEKFSGSEMTDEERKSAADAYATEYAKLLSEGKTEEQAAEGARKVLRDRIDQYSTPDPKGGDNDPPKVDDTGNGGSGRVYLTIANGSTSVAGKPTFSNKKKEITIDAGKSVKIIEGAPEGYRFHYWTAVNGKRTGTTTTIPTQKGDKELRVLVYYALKEIKPVTGPAAGSGVRDNGTGSGNDTPTKTPGEHYYKITYTDLADGKAKSKTSGKIYTTVDEAQKAGDSKAEALGLFDKKKYSNVKITAYKTGGLVDYTGLAMVHGSASKPEAFLNAKQTAQIKEALMLQTKEGLLSSLQDSLLKFQSTIDGTVSGITSEANNSSINIQPGAVVIQVEELANNYDVEKLSNDVMNRMTAIAAKATNRGVNRR